MSAEAGAAEGPQGSETATNEWAGDWAKEAFRAGWLELVYPGGLHLQPLAYRWGARSKSIIGLVIYDPCASKGNDLTGKIIDVEYLFELKDGRVYSSDEGTIQEVSEVPRGDGWRLCMIDEADRAEVCDRMRSYRSQRLPYRFQPRPSPIPSRWKNAASRSMAAWAFVFDSALNREDESPQPQATDPTSGSRL